jgi:tetratricopeptide (TPR) repeat protein
MSAWRARGDILIALRRNQEAAASLEKALEIDSGDAQAWHLYGYALTDLNRYDEALTSFQKAIDINPQLWYAWNGHGYALLMLERFDEALVSLTRAIIADPSSANPWRWKGRVLLKLKRLEESLDCFEKALTLNPQYAGARYDKAAALAETGPRETAMAAYDEAMNAAVKSGDKDCYEQALDFYCRAIESTPRDAGPWARKGKVLSYLKRYDEAKAANLQAVEINPDYRYQSNWSNRNFGRFVSPDLVKDCFLDVKVVLLLQGENLLGTPMYSYTEITGRNLKEMFAKMQAGENFRPADFGEVLASGEGEPPEEIRMRMTQEFNMLPIPIPNSVPVSVISSDSPEGKRVSTTTDIT